MSQVTAVRSRAVTSFEPSGATTVAVNFPSDVQAGDRLLLLCSGEGNGTDTFASTGWSSLGSTGGGSGITLVVLQLDGDAVGTETGTFNVTVNSATTDYSFLCIGIADPDGTTEIALTTASSGNTNPPSLTPAAGSRFYVWIAGGCVDLGRAVTAWPADYSQWVSRISGTQRLMSAERELVAASQDPGVFAHTSDGWGACTIAVPCAAPAAGNFPVMETTATSLWETNATSQTMNLPADIAAGDLLLAEVSTDDQATAAIIGWTELGTETIGGPGTGGRSTLLYKEADGSEGATVSVTLDPTESGSAVCRRISGATTDDLEAAFATNLSTLQPDPPSLTPVGGAAEILWLVGTGQDGLNFPQSWSLGFGAAVTNISPSVSTSMVTNSGVRAENTAVVDPGVIVMGGTAQETIAYTVAIYPSGSGPPPPTPSSNRMGGTGAIRRAGRPQPARTGAPPRSQPSSRPAPQRRQPKRPWLPPRSN